MAENDDPGTGRSGRRWPLWLRVSLTTVVALAALVVISGLWVAADARRVELELRSAAAAIQDARDRVLEHDTEGSAGRLASAQEHAARAHVITGRPHWWVASVVPVVGPTVSAVRVVAAVTDDLASLALPELTTALAVVDTETLVPRDGVFDLGPLLDVAPAVVAADRTVQESLARVAGIDSSAVFGPVAGPVDELSETLADVATTTATASRAVRLLPPMLGADGPRTYLLLVQSPAEIRASGGMPGALALVTADRGSIALTESFGASGYGLAEPILPLTAEERLIFSDRLGTFMSGVTFTPDFPRAAELARALLADKEGVTVDGVVSVDPVALQSVLAATGPVMLPDGVTLDGTNAADVLLHDVYLRIADPREQDSYFAAAARGVFEELVDGVAEPAGVVEALAGAARDGRLRVWSADAGEQALLADTVLSGRLEGEREGVPEVGVYFNDGTAAKLGYYLRYSVRGDRIRCNADGTRVVSLTVSMTSTAPPDAAELPTSILGEYGLVDPGVLRTNVLVYGPSEGWVGATDVASLRQGDQHVVVKTVELSPGESEAFQFDVTTGPGQDGPMRVNVTPGVVPADVFIADRPCGP